MIKVFVSGCFDIIHGGHVEFLSAAKEVGEYLVVCLPSDEVLALHKERKPSLPLEHKIRILEAMEFVDEVVIGDETTIKGLNFIQKLMETKPRYLVATEDDVYSSLKQELCSDLNIHYIQLPKTNTHAEAISTSGLINVIRAPIWCPLRIDFAGGWLDCPENATERGYVVNCSISPRVSLSRWPYHLKGGLGGSGAYALLTGREGVKAEAEFGNGWQDAAAIKETGLCVWRAHKTPKLEFKMNPEWLQGKIALLWTGEEHNTRDIRKLPRDYDLIIEASQKATQAVRERSLTGLAEAVSLSYRVQQIEGMASLPARREAAYKYCGSGWGGYAMYLFSSTLEREAFLTDHPNAVSIEPYMDDMY